MNYLNNLQSLVNPDALTYFLVNSGVYLGVAAGVFCFCGLVFGRLIWGLDRSKLRKAEKVLDSLKEEVATLKVRIAEGVSLPGRHFGASLPVALSMPPAPKGPFYPESRMFYTWGEEDWEPPQIQPQPQHPGQAFSVWTSEDYEQPIAALIAPSQAFTVWTSGLWSPQPVRQEPLPPSQAFGLWTEPDFELEQRGLHVASVAFSLWTSPEWSPRAPFPQPIEPSRAFAIWTDPSFEPVQRFLQAPSQAFTVWTEGDLLVPSRVERLPLSQAFTLWAPPPMDRVLTPLPEPPDQAPEKPIHHGSVSAFSRAMAAARDVLWGDRSVDAAPHGTNGSTPHAPAVPIVPWYEAPEIIQRWHRLPTSRAFTVWTKTSEELEAEQLEESARENGVPSTLASHAIAPDTEAEDVALAGDTAVLLEKLSDPVGEELEDPLAMQVTGRAPKVEALHHEPKKELLHDAHQEPEPLDDFVVAADEAAPLSPVSHERPEGHEEREVAARVSSIAEQDLAPAAQEIREEDTAFPAAESIAPPTAAEDAPMAPTLSEPSAPRFPILASPPSPKPRPRGDTGEIAPFPSLSVDPEALPDPHVSHAFEKEAANGELRHDARLGMVYDTKPENPDDLTAMSGISAERAHQLNEWGVYFFKQIAHWAEPQVREFARRLAVRERFIRNHWIDQARALHFHRHRERI